MGAQEIPHPMPRQLASELNVAFDDLKIIDENTRFVLRRFVARTYALAHEDGSNVERENAYADIRAKRVQ